MEISVIIPIYNGEKTIETCLESVFRQSFMDYEIVLIDDGSNDQTAVICKKFQEKDSRIKYYYQENAGVSSARNKGIRISKGKFITFIDADDVIDGEYLEHLYRRCMEENADISVCDVVVEECEEQKRIFSCANLLMNSTEAIEKMLSREEINSGPCAKLFKRDIIENLEFPELKTYEDIIFVLHAFENATKIVSTSQVKYHYISTPNSAMHSLDIMNSNDVLVASSEIAEYLRMNRKRFTDRPFYTTVSHVMQYIQMVHYETENVKSSAFIINSYKFMKKYRKDIWKNREFPFKEKCLYLLLSFNLRYCGGIRVEKLCDVK